ETFNSDNSYLYAIPSFGLARTITATTCWNGASTAQYPSTLIVATGPGPWCTPQTAATLIGTVTSAGGVCGTLSTITFLAEPNASYIIAVSSRATGSVTHPATLLVTVAA
ncbi:hypothetical protein HaLaN_30778, partial [Haematococcus lacustris]